MVSECTNTNTGKDEPDFVQTKDGTLTLKEKTTGEWYHNSAGAYTESYENYSKPALFMLNNLGNEKKLRVLDVCFGLGYNSFTLLSELLKSNLQFDEVEINAIEYDESLIPVMARVVDQPCYRNIKELGFFFADNEGNKVSFEDFFDRKSITRESGSRVLKGKFFSKNECQIQSISLTIYFDDLRKICPALARSALKSYDIIFHDPFSPAKFPQFWTIDLFRLYKELLKEPKGLLFTYSIATAIRSALIQSGFSIYRTTAVGAKAGGTLALSNLEPVNESSMDTHIPRSEKTIFASCKSPGISNGPETGMISVLSEDEIRRVLSSSGVPYRDPEMNRQRLEVIKARELEIEAHKKSKLDS